MANEQRLIDANELMEGLKSLTGMFTDEIGFVVGLEPVLWKVDAQPTVDAVEVVRCKDCEHWMPGDSFMGDSVDDMQRVGGCPYVRFRRLENDFCSYGEKMDGDGNDS